LDLSSSALYAGDSHQYSVIAGSAIRNRWFGVLSYRPGLSSRFRRGPLARECPVAGTLPPPAAARSPRMRHESLDAPENLAKEGPCQVTFREL